MFYFPTETATVLLLLTLGSPLASARPAVAVAARTSFPAWQAPGPNDVRSPCPGINTLANHGLLPRSGKNITEAMVQSAIKGAYNFGADFAELVTGAAATVHSPYDGSFDLDDVDMHNYPIEQDASLSREDAYFGDQTSFDPAIFNRTLSHFAGSDYTSYATVGAAHYAAVSDSRARNPEFLYGARQYVGGYVRDATGISAMSDPTSGKARVDWYAYWMRNERLPTELGWTTSKEEINFATLTALAASIAAATPQDVAPVAITLATVKDVFELRDPLTGVLVNVTGLRRRSSGRITHG